MICDNDVIIDITVAIYVVPYIYVPDMLLLSLAAIVITNANHT